MLTTLLPRIGKNTTKIIILVFQTLTCHNGKILEANQRAGKESTSTGQILTHIILNYCLMFNICNICLNLIIFGQQAAWVADGKVHHVKTVWALVLDLDCTALTWKEVGDRWLNIFVFWPWVKQKRVLGDLWKKLFLWDCGHSFPSK